jgi:acyl-CoA thioesterase I
MGPCLLALCAALSAYGAMAEPAPATPSPPTFLEVADLNHYTQSNAALSSPNRAVRRVVFIGDSITEAWGAASPDYFAATRSISRVNRGISGQSTPQMLLRFQQDVIALRPTVVHILAGINDIARNWGAMPLEATEATIASMAELARAHGIQVVIGSVLPARAIPWRPGLNPGVEIVSLNDWLRAYCHRSGIVYADYYSALTDGDLGTRADLAPDGVHPSPAGYRTMEPLADAAIRRAIGLRSRGQIQEQH